MSANIFREKSIDDINSPEELNGYLKITNPPVWFTLAAVILILVGSLIWGCVSKIEAKTDGVVVSDDSGCVCYASEQDIGRIKNGTIVRIDNDEYEVTDISENSISAENNLNGYSMKLGGFESGENVYVLNLSPSVKPGNYACKIVLESVSPISFIFNSSN